MKHYRLSLFAIFASAILLISLVNPQNVLAQDETPPPTDAPAITDQPPETDEATPTVEPVAAQESTPPDAPAQEQVGVSEILDQVPDGMDVVVLGADGQPEPLASQAAADIIVSGDPMWCPAGVLPGGAGCTASFASFTDLITELETLNQTGAGTIYIDANYDATTAGDVNTDIVFDYGAIGLTDLVFQGGWDFGLNQVTGTSTLALGSGSLQFLDWGAGSLTLQDIVLSGGDGLYIGDSNINSPITTANVVLENVSVSGTNLGTFIGTDGNVSVSASDFSNNDSDGLSVEAGGNITLNNITANGNDGIGASLFNCGCTTAEVIVNDSEFNNNDGTGIIILSGGDVTITDTDMFGNDDAGIIVASDRNVVLTGLNSGYNGDIGVGVSATGYVSVADSWFGFNDAAGFGVDNEGNVTLSNSAFFDNAVVGAYVTSDGSVNVSNSFFGSCFLDPSMCGDQQVGIIVDALGPVNIFNSQFNENTSTGLILMSGGDVFLKNVTANGNDFVGAVVITPGNVKVCGGSYSYNDRFGFTSTAGTVFMSEQTLITGNGDLPMDLGPGTTVVTYNCTPKTGGRSQSVQQIACEDDQIGIELKLPDGDSLIGVELDLPNGDSLIVPCPMGGPASVDRLDLSQLPGSLPDGFTFVSGLHAEAARDGLMVSFVMPLADAQYTILYWNGEAWVELEGFTTVDGMFAVTPVDPGMYVLATK